MVSMPCASSASTIHSIIGRPAIGIRVLCAARLRGCMRRPNPAASTMALMLSHRNFRLLSGLRQAVRLQVSAFCPIDTGGCLAAAPGRDEQDVANEGDRALIDVLASGETEHPACQRVRVW